MFSDGTKWVRPNEKVDVDFNDGFDNNVFMLLTQSDLAIFREKVIEKIRLYIHDMEVEYLDGENFKNYISIVSGKK